MRAAARCQFPVLAYTDGSPFRTQSIAEGEPMAHSSAYDLENVRVSDRCR
jgi:hypothetical protein